MRAQGCQARMTAHDGSSLTRTPTRTDVNHRRRHAADLASLVLCPTPVQVTLTHAALLSLLPLPLPLSRKRAVPPGGCLARPHARLLVHLHVHNVTATLPFPPLPRRLHDAALAGTSWVPRPAGGPARASLEPFCEPGSCFSARPCAECGARLALAPWVGPTTYLPDH